LITYYFEDFVFWFALQPESSEAFVADSGDNALQMDTGHDA